MRNVTDRTRNPFGMSPPCESPCPGGHDAVFGYGDANADFHVVGDHPGRHGGTESGIPFTGVEAGRRLLAVLDSVGLLERREERPLARDVFLSYRCMCCVPGDPSPETYARLEPFFDAELRAINAHVLVPVGERAVEHVLETYTNRSGRLGTDHRALHAREVHGRGYTVVPLREPAEWTDRDEDRTRERLGDVLASDYRQLSDLGRFGPEADPYWVR